jgi:hypothetical protein
MVEKKKGEEGAGGGGAAFDAAQVNAMVAGFMEKQAEQSALEREALMQQMRKDAEARDQVAAERMREMMYAYGPAAGGGAGPGRGDQPQAGNDQGPNDAADLTTQAKRRTSDLARDVRRELLKPTDLAEAEAKRMRPNGWTRESYEEQFKINHQVKELNEQAAGLIKDGNVEQGLNLMASGEKIIASRQKLLLVADRAGSWKAAELYQEPEMATDEKDEKKIRKCVEAASAKTTPTKQPRGGGGTRGGHGGGRRAGGGGGYPPGPPPRQLDQQNGGGGYQPSGNSHGGGVCFTCNRAGHYSRDCPSSGRGGRGGRGGR